MASRFDVNRCPGCDWTWRSREDISTTRGDRSNACELATPCRDQRLTEITEVNFDGLAHSQMVPASRLFGPAFNAGKDATGHWDTARGGSSYTVRRST